MSEVVTFLDWTPPKRYDSLPWTDVEIEEAAERDSDTWTLLETIPLAPLDADPSNPAPRSFTTELGTALDYWYRITFLDGTGDRSQPTSPIQNEAAAANVTAYITTDELFRILQITSPSPEQQIAGERAILAAAGEINSYIAGASLANLSEAWQLAIVQSVNLKRAVEHWNQYESPAGIIGIGDAIPIIASKDTFDRHAYELAPLKADWGFA